MDKLKAEADSSVLLGGGVGDAVGLDGLDAHLGKVLPVTLQLLVLFLPLEVEDQNLIAPALAQHFGDHLGGGRFGHGSRFIADGQHIAELDGLILVGNHALNLHHVAWRDAILLTTGTNHRVHKPSSASPTQPERSRNPKIARAETSAPRYAQAPQAPGRTSGSTTTGRNRQTRVVHRFWGEKVN